MWTIQVRLHSHIRTPSTNSASQIQCLTQILANRISLVLYNPEKARRLKLNVALIIGMINVSVFIVWIPARLQISESWIKANNVWDRFENCIFMVVDVILNVFFMRLVKSKLVANGLHKYNRVYRFNGLLVCVSIIIDVSVVTPLAAAVWLCNTH